LGGLFDQFTNHPMNQRRTRLCKELASRVKWRSELFGRRFHEE